MKLNLPAEVSALCRSEPSEVVGELRGSAGRQLWSWLAIIVLGTGAYGAAIGLWRAPIQALYVGVKMPTLIFLTLSVNALVNGMLASLFGSGLTFRQTWLAILHSFAVFALIVGSVSPVAILFTWTCPSSLDSGAARWHETLLLAHTGLIAFAGIVANLKLLGVLRAFSGSNAVALRVLVGWLAGNLFVGAQLSYNLRPFFGNPALPVQFLRPNPFEGSFYEVVARSLFRPGFHKPQSAPVTP